jgi:hypothetical protein
MRAHEIIRSVLDLIDAIENPQAPAVAVIEPVNSGSYNDEGRRFKQIFDLLSNGEQMYDNSPAEVVAGIDSVTKDAGGGWNGPKNPADIRSDSVSMYPNYLHKPGE